MRKLLFLAVLTAILQLNGAADQNVELGAAAQSGNLFEVIRLIDEGADPIAPMRKEKGVIGTTPLMKAVHGGHLDVATYLLGLGAQINELDPGLGITPFHLAIQERNLPIVKLLAENGADIDLQTMQGDAPYILAKHYARIRPTQDAQTIVNYLHQISIDRHEEKIKNELEAAQKLAAAIEIGSTPQNIRSTRAQHGTLYYGLQRELARQDFFEKLETVMKQHPESTKPEIIIEKTVSLISEFPDSFGLYIQDLINHKLLPTPNDDVWTLNNMYIDDLDGLEHIPNIKHARAIYLSDNRLQTIPANAFKGFYYLTDLHIDNNRLQNIASNALNSLRALTWLHLQNNELESMEAGTFTGDSYLELIELSKNHLKAIKPNLFKGLSNLKALFLDNNHIIKPEEQARIVNEVKNVSPQAYIDLDNQTDDEAQSTS